MSTKNEINFDLGREGKLKGGNSLFDPFRTKEIDFYNDKFTNEILFSLEEVFLSELKQNEEFLNEISNSTIINQVEMKGNNSLLFEINNPKYEGINFIIKYNKERGEGEITFTSKNSLGPERWSSRLFLTILDILGKEKIIEIIKYRGKDFFVQFEEIKNGLFEGDIVYDNRKALEKFFEKNYNIPESEQDFLGEGLITPLEDVVYNYVDYLIKTIRD